MCMLIGLQSLSNDIIQGRRQEIYFGTVNLICSGFKHVRLGLWFGGFWSKIPDRGRLGGRGRGAPSEGSTRSAN